VAYLEVYWGCRDARQTREKKERKNHKRKKVVVEKSGEGERETAEDYKLFNGRVIKSDRKIRRVLGNPWPNKRAVSVKLHTN